MTASRARLGRTDRHASVLLGRIAGCDSSTPRNLTARPLRRSWHAGDSPAHPRMRIAVRWPGSPAGARSDLRRAEDDGGRPRRTCQRRPGARRRLEKELCVSPGPAISTSNGAGDTVGGAAECVAPRPVARGSIPGSNPPRRVPAAPFTTDPSRESRLARFEGGASLAAFPGSGPVRSGTKLRGDR